MSIRSKISGLRSLWAFDNRWQLMFNHLLYPGEAASIYKLGEHRLYVDRIAGDAVGVREIHCSDEYSRFTSKFRLDHPIRILDLGANAGSFPFLFARKGLRFEKLVSVEMNPNTFKRMRFNVESNLECEVATLNAAVCGIRRELTLRLGKGGGSDSIYQAADAPPGQSRDYVVQGVTLDDLIGTHFGDRIVDVCKMDVEGAEYEVFENPGHGFAARIRYLLIEVHGKDEERNQQLYATVESLGFEPIVPEVAIPEDTIRAFRNTRLPEGGR